MDYDGGTGTNGLDEGGGRDRAGGVEPETGDLILDKQPFIISGLPSQSPVFDDSAAFVRARCLASSASAAFTLHPPCRNRKRILSRVRQRLCILSRSSS